MSSSGPSGAMWRAIALLAGLILLLGAFYLVVLLLNTSRRWRRMRERPAKGDQAAAAPDAWSEAGRRAEPFD